VAGNGRAFAKLDNIIGKIHRLSSGEFQRQAVGDVATTMYELAEEGAAAGRNPTGRAWRKLSPNTRNKGMPLRVAASSLHRAVEAALARVSVNFPHAVAQNRGAGGKLKDKRTGKALSPGQLKSLKKGQAKSLVKAGALTRAGWKLPARSMLPKGGRLPPKWRDAVNAALRLRFGQLWDRS
jgi:hypothetical protein